MQKRREARSVGKNGQSVPVVVATWSKLSQAGPCRIYCPCLKGLPAELAAHLAILPIHDANGVLLRELPRETEHLAPEFAAVCLSDPFRRAEMLFAAIRAAGIRGIVNFPSVTTLFGSDRDDNLRKLYRRELDHLDLAKTMGFEVLRIGVDVANGDFPVNQLEFLLD
ncbi:phosphoenolpyruvate hydrolase family protein [Qingshengfaniella alkalisoli]|uniref:TIM-barrel domain-containing protein n=1 Tax=Qingshengfaniella alkalisoli TaxID=2599296 RepID=A0A5B8I9Q0_9RHOB|nr:phosphoenolpyruvate hydrolase family protein [Qingshengfaniella alkalisoli]QDY71045.1 hypothetical protein FPZ52_15125 [Qingshengfaniella alkalisoli]